MSGCNNNGIEFLLCGNQQMSLRSVKLISRLFTLQAFAILKTLELRQVHSLQNLLNQVKSIPKQNGGINIFLTESIV